MARLGRTLAQTLEEAQAFLMVEKLHQSILLIECEPTRGRDRHPLVDVRIKVFAQDSVAMLAQAFELNRRRERSLVAPAKWRQLLALSALQSDAQPHGDRVGMRVVRDLVKESLDPDLLSNEGNVGEHARDQTHREGVLALEKADGQ